MGQGKFIVSYPALRDILGLPPGVMIYEVKNRGNATLEVYIESPEIPKSVTPVLVSVVAEKISTRIEIDDE